jgi:hypothetical protein
MISRFAVLLAGLALLWVDPVALAATATPAPITAMTNTFITCSNGSTWSPTNAIFRGGVRVFDAQLYLECEHLDVYYPSNSTPNPANPDRTEAPSIGNITAIVAHTNLLMMLNGATIIGDRAHYWPTNDMIQVVGEIVVIETEKGYFYGTNFTFNRRSMEMHSEGPSTLESKPGVGLLEGTNAPPGAPRPLRPRNPVPTNPAKPNP